MRDDSVVAMKFDEEKVIAVAVDEYIRGDCFEVIQLNLFDLELHMT